MVQSTLSLGLVALSTMAIAVDSFVHQQATPISSAAVVASRASPQLRPLHMSILPDDSSSSNFWSEKSSSDHQNLDPKAELDYLPNDKDVSELRALRWEREALVQSKFASGDELYEIRQRTIEVKQELIDARKQFNASPTKIEKVAANKRIYELEKELVNLNGRDAEFMYAVSRDMMAKAEMDGDTRLAEKYRVLAEEARLCIPELNMHGLWVGKYGEFGYEMINVTYTDDDTMIATKITGDKNVPAGKVTFTVDLAPVISPTTGQLTHLEPIELDSKAKKQWGKKYLPRHLGKGQVAGENFTNAQWMEGQMILVGRFFSFAWVPIGTQIFFGRPSSDLTIKMLKEAKEEDPVAIMRESAQNMWEETHWNELDFDDEGCFE